MESGSPSIVVLELVCTVESPGLGETRTSGFWKAFKGFLCTEVWQSQCPRGQHSAALSLMPCRSDGPGPWQPVSLGCSGFPTLTLPIRNTQSSPESASGTPASAATARMGSDVANRPRGPGPNRQTCFIWLGWRF